MEYIFIVYVVVSICVNFLYLYLYSLDKWRFRVSTFELINLLQTAMSTVIDNDYENKQWIDVTVLFYIKKNFV